MRTKKNIERVRRDEEKAAAEEKEKQRKIALAEQEARTELLRAKARNKSRFIEGEGSSTLQSQKELKDDKQNSLDSNNTDNQALVSSHSQSSKAISIPGLGERNEHINFFKDIEDGLTKQGKNKEHEAEKKQEQEDLEKKIGLLTYLGQTALDEKKTAPWYLKKKKRKNKSKRSDTESESDEAKDLEKKLKHSVQEKRRESLDPLVEMKEFLHKKKHKHGHKKSKRKDKESKKRSRSSSSKHEASTKKVIDPLKEKCASKSIEQLRAERIARERQEKQRSLVLLKESKDGPFKSKVDQYSSSESDDEKNNHNSRKRKYNSQYNPDFIQESKHKRPRNNFY